MPATKPPTTAQPSYPALQKLLQSMNASGKKDSFEKLMACIIAHLTGECVDVAKSGSQLGDALNVKATIAIQAKRYQETTALNLNEIEGELREIIRQAPQLEVYVLGATKSAQDIPRLQEIEVETGVSIVVVDWYNPNDSILGQLCAVCWDAIRHLKPLDTLSEDWARWLHEEASKTLLIQAAEAIRRELMEEPILQSRLAYVSKQHLNEQFFPKGNEDQTVARFNQIDLSKAIPREAVSQIQQWWNEGTSSPLALVCGQEGMGKSWVTAAIVHQIAASSDDAVFWVDSRDWNTCRDLKTLLEQAFRYLVNERSLLRLVSKAINKWQKPLLIVLDGVNERDALESAKNILRDFCRITARDDKPPRHIRLLFTSRERAAKELRTESNFLKLFHVPPYSDDEMALILPRLKGGLTIAEIPAALLAHVARIPRYLPTCIRLLPELGGLQHITVELVLWHDLLLRLREDAQVRKQLGIEDSGDAESILSQLARQCSTEGEIATTQLVQLFDTDFRSIRHDLQELRWLSDARQGQSTAKISPDHLRLGWALYLRETLLAANATPTEMEDRLQRAMEPLAAEDHRISALRLCGRLSLTDPAGFGTDVQLKRMALLRLWIKSRNIAQVNEELSFWHERDEPFYLALVENLLPELDRSDARQRLVLPLVRAWGNAPSDSLIEALTRWIHLIAGSPERWSELDWPAHLDGGDIVIGGHRFPYVEDERQLSLTGAAITILSHRADNRMLSPLVLAVATDHYSSCYFPPPPEVVARQGSMAKGQWSRNKDMLSLCGPLMRWSYGESALSVLQKLVDDNPTDNVLRYGAQWMAAFLKIESIPPQLSLPPDCSYYPLGGPHPVEELIKGNRLLESCDDEELLNNIQRLGYYDPIGTLACWDEVDWHQEDRMILQDAAPRVLGREPSRQLRGNEMCFAWLARWNPRGAAICATQAISNFRFTENAILPDDFALHVLPHPEERQSVVSCLRTILENAPGDSYRTIASWPGLYLAHILEEDEWQDWIQWLESQIPVRLSMKYEPVPEVLNVRFPNKVISWLHERLLQLEFTPETVSEIGVVTFLAYLASSKDMPNAELFEKVKQWLEVNREGRSMHMMFRLWIAVAPDFASLLRDAELLSLSSYFRHFIQHRWSALIAEGEVFAPDDTPYEKLLHYVPWDELGRFLLRHGRTDDFRRWGGDVIEAAKAYFDNPERIPLPKSPLQRKLNDSGRVNSVGPPAAVLPGRTFVSASSAWLAERDQITPQDFLLTDQGQPIEEINRRNDAWRDWFNDSSKDPGHQSRHWLFFSARYEVFEWASRHPDEFTDKAIPFLTDPKYFSPSFDESLLSGIGRNFVDAWFYLYPSAAEDHHRKAPFHQATEMQYGFEASYQLIWHPALLTKRGQLHRPRQAILEARNDLEIARLTWAAHLRGAKQDILDLAQDWAGSGHMSERALAISILAWIESPAALDVLQKLESQDISRWVRQHARWAIRVWKTEDYAKKLYRRASQQTETWLASVMLEQLHPALTSAAKWWMPREFRSIFMNSNISEDIRALLYSSYYRRSRTTRTNETIWDRDMKKHWRGDRLDSHSESLAPHWQGS